MCKIIQLSKCEIEKGNHCSDASPKCNSITVYINISYISVKIFV